MNRYGEVCLRQIQCDMCGREFIPAPCSIYNMNFAGKVHHFCSWTCYNEACKVKEKFKSSRYARDRRAIENENNQKVSKDPS